MGSKEEDDVVENRPVLLPLSNEVSRLAGPGHRRAQSEVLHKQTNGISRFKSSMQRAWKWGHSRDEGYFSTFNPEILANQKRQWYQLHSKATDHTKYMEPTSLFEHFIVAGLSPDANLQEVEDAYVSRKKWEREMANTKHANRRNQGPPAATLHPQILFKYPRGKRLALRLKDLAALCFPGGIKARLAERSPSLSDLNVLVYGQEHLGKDDSSFIFSLKVADNATLYGVCLHVREIVQRPPGILGTSSPLPQKAQGCSSFLVSAPRCYCLLTRVPFFELHYEMLNSITMSEASDLSQVRETNKDGQKHMDDCASEAPSENHCEFSERTNEGCESGFTSPEIRELACSRSRPLERLGSCESLFSPARSMIFEDEDDDVFENREKDLGDELVMEWARENKNDFLQIVCAYHSLHIPQRGEKIVFQPLEHLQAIEYMRPPVSALVFYQKYLNSCEPAEANSKLAAAEEALSLSIWTTANICRVLSLESVLTLISGVLLEKQIVIICPNLGLLSASVLSLIPVIQPFQWQSLLLPVLPSTMFEFLDAPVPFIVGVQDKPTDLKIKTSNLVLVDLYNDEVKTCQLPTLPRHKELLSELVPVHGRMTLESSFARKHPVYRCSEAQVEAANHFLYVMTRYMESLCADMRSHSITSVQSNNDRVSLLLKDSFIDSFPSRDRAFIKLFVDTQIFTVLSDSRLSSFEHDHT
ncbi:hypothetical protein ACFE04_030705 [Oxalis oulophora]